ncbi:nitroreductase [Streptomyces sp. KY70]|uniref:nitroreductase n=1 Tax=Streptomyces sp. KY70 TaxID=2772432 RepID=UPI001AF8B34A|nr:protein of unknown function [Streptomyces sp. KY70]
MPQAPPAAPGLLSRALADARSPRVPRTVPYLPERAFPWGGPGLHPAGAGGGVDLDRVLRLSLAAPRKAGGRLRPVASAGALHPVRAHLLVGPGCSLPPGRYAYDPRAHRAHPRGRAPPTRPPGAVVVLTVTAARTVAHYGHRAWPLLLLDAGHAAAALALAAAPGDVRVSLDADGEELAAAAGLPRAADRQTRRPGVESELPLVAIWLRSADALAPSTAPLTAWAALPCAAIPLPQPGAGGNATPRELFAARHLLTYLSAGADSTWHPAARPTPVTDETLRTRRSAPPPTWRTHQPPTCSPGSWPPPRGPGRTAPPGPRPSAATPRAPHDHAGPSPPAMPAPPSPTGRRASGGSVRQARCWSPTAALPTPRRP